MSNPIWKFIDGETHPGEYNMMFDEMLALRLAEGTGIPTLRLYQWNPWAISLGHNQADSEIDHERCRLLGIDIVRRPTGGRAILHAEELTYSVVMYADRKGIQQIYNEISRALVKGLELFGIDVSLQKSQPNFPELYRSASSIPCFSSSARYEIEWHGKKLVGSAQRRYSSDTSDVVLQHGSILCGPAHRRLPEYLRLSDTKSRNRIVEDLERKTADLCEASGRPVNVNKLVECIKKGFEESFGIALGVMDTDIIKRHAHV